MRPELLAELKKRKKELERELEQVNGLIATLASYDGGSVKVESNIRSLPTRPETKPVRVRGVLAAAKRALEKLPEGAFTKNQLLDALQRDREFANKTITPSNIRNTLRLLTQIGAIKVESEATATSCARYIRAASEGDHQEEPSSPARTELLTQAG